MTSRAFDMAEHQHPRTLSPMTRDSVSPLGLQVFDEEPEVGSGVGPADADVAQLDGHEQGRVARIGPEHRGPRHP
jgi:hypothetical protein